MSKQNAALAQIVESVIRNTRPDEIIFVEAVASSSFSPEKDQMLGWGGGTEILLLTPLLTEFLRSKPFLEFCKDIGKGAISTVAERLGKTVAEKVTNPHTPTLDVNSLNLLVGEFATKLEGSGFEKQEAAHASDALKAVIVDHPEWAKRLIEA